MPSDPPSDASTTLLVNRAPVLTLWTAVVAERLGFDRDEALTLGRALAGLNAQSKGRSLGIFKPASAAESKRRKAEIKPGEAFAVELMGRAVPALRTKSGVRARDSDGSAADPAAVERYLRAKFGDALPRARAAMEALAASLTPALLADDAFALYEKFRPAIPPGTRGWGAKGEFDLARIRAMAAKSRR